MSNDKPQISKQTLDLIIVNTGLLMTIDGDSIVWYLSRYGLDVKFNVEIVRDEMLNDAHTYEAFPRDAVIYTHLGANNHFVTLVGLKGLSEHNSSTYYRPDLRFIIAIDAKYLDVITFTEYCGGSSDLFDYLQMISKNELDPANVVSCTFNRDWNNFFKSEDEEFGGNCFKSYVEKLLKLRAELREGQQTQVSTNVTV